MTSEKSGKMHYAWLIFIGCCFVYAGSMAASISIVGVYMLPVSQSIGVGPGDWMLWMTICSIVSAIATSFWGQAIQSRNINVVTSLSAILLALAVFMFSFGNNVMWFYIWGAVIGLAVPCIATLTVPTLLGNWFGKKQRGRVLGIAAAFTGVGTFCWAPLFTMILQNFGWSTAYQINAALICVFLLPWTLFVFKFKPSDKGLEPYGFDAELASQEADAMKLGASRATALKSAPFWIMMVVVLFTSIGMGFNSNQVAIATEAMDGIMAAPEAAMLGASMISVAAVGNICGKVAFGFMSNRAGLKATFVVFVLAFLVGFGLWVFAPASAALLVGAFLFGSHNALISVGYPLIVRSLYGNKDYSKIFSNLMTVNGLMGGISGTIISFVYQALGSYQAALIAAMVMVIVIGALLLVSCSFIGKIKWDKAAA
ncbi:MAG TPA: MFS transporter [Eggerthellaceae bacterium]|nr:MFS transporter [Eggerthellaceae bacterium]